MNDKNNPNDTNILNDKIKNIFLFRYDTDYYNEAKKINKKYDLANIQIVDKYFKYTSLITGETFYSTYRIAGIYDPDLHEWTWGWSLGQTDESLLNHQLLLEGLYQTNNDMLPYKLLLVTNKFKITDYLQIDIVISIYVAFFKTVLVPYKKSDSNVIIYLHISNINFNIYK